MKKSEALKHIDRDSCSRSAGSPGVQLVSRRALWVVSLLFAALIMRPIWAADATKVQPDYATKVIYHWVDDEFPHPPRAAYIPEAVLNDPDLLAAALPDKGQRERSLRWVERRRQRKANPSPSAPQTPREISERDFAERAWEASGARTLAMAGGACDSYGKGRYDSHGIQPAILGKFAVNAASQAVATVVARVPAYTNTKVHSSHATLYYLRVDRVIRGESMVSGRVLAVGEPYGALTVGGWRSCSFLPPDVALKPGDAVFVAGSSFHDSEDILLSARLFRMDGDMILPHTPAQPGDEPLSVASVLQLANEAQH